VSYLPPTSVPTSGNVTINVASTSNAIITSAQSIAITSSLAGTLINGTVLAGSLPVAGSSVQLYEAGNTGYGSAAFPLTISNGSNSVLTNASGVFTVPAGYSCTSENSLLYLVATGGTVSGQSSANAQLGLMTAIGPCSNISSTAHVVINEVTTVASAWALAQFTGAPSGGFQDYELIGSSASNYGSGLTTAFAAVNNLVDITTGQARLFTPGGGSFTPPGGATPVLNGAVPQAEINTLADAINSCAATTGGTPGDGSPCDNFFFASNVNPPGGNGGTHANEPSSILPAIMEIAKYPGKNSSFGPSDPSSGSQIYNLVAALVNAPYTPTLVSDGSGAPTDWTISLSFTGGGLEGQKRANPHSNAMAIDANGNLWFSNRTTSTVSELSGLGVALSPYATGPLAAAAGGFNGGGLNGPQQIAVDPTGGVWVLNSGNLLTELDTNGIAVSCTGSNPDVLCGGGTLSSPYSGAGNANNTSVGIAIDSTGNIWVSDSGSPGDVAEYAGFSGALVGTKQITHGSPLSPAGVGFTSLTSSSDPLDTQPANPSQGIAIDPKANVWVLDQANFTAVELSAAGALELVDHGYQQTDPNTGKPINPALTSDQFGTTLAFNSASNLFLPNTASDQLYELFTPGSASDPNSLGLGAIENLTAVPGIDPPIAVDGSGNLWMFSLGGQNGSITVPPSLGEFSASGTLLNENTTSSGYVGTNTAGSTPESIAVDSSGNVWILFSPTSVTEFVGVATPAVTPISKGKYGSKP
jgi:hypothetical protein